MANIKKILALIPENNRQTAEAFFTELADGFSYLFCLELDYVSAQISYKVGQYDGLFTFSEIDCPLPTLKFTTEASENQQTFFVDGTCFTDPKSILSLTRYLTEFYQKIQPDILSYLPYQVRFFDQSHRLVYSNHKPESSLPLSDDDSPKRLDEALIQELNDEEISSLHFPVAESVFDQILIQSYQKLYDRQNQLMGTLESVHDFKPVLSAYLKETGQALVGWSDTTSGPSVTDG
ncbi:multidrug transporter [Streptococcus sp. H31]|uniref:multidrug transporter n=1 Tax=Streptococcus huangxiaojuni TaxID=3237239 RepID=UPI0034A336DA